MQSRRAYLGKAAAIGALGIAGCLEGDTGDGSTDTSSGSGSGTEAGSGSTDTVDSEIEITIASEAEPDNIYTRAAESFAENVESESDGRLSVEVVPGGAYGTNAEITEMVRTGDVEMSYGTAAYYSYATKYNWIAHPFTLMDYDALTDLFEGDIGDELRQEMIDQGNMRWLGNPIAEGYRYLYSVEPWQSPEDGEGRNLRAPELQPYQEILSEAFNTGTEPIPLGDVYTSVDTGLIDGWENASQGAYSFDTHEFTDYVNDTQHSLQSDGVYVNEDFFQELDETHQDILQDAMNGVGEEHTEVALEEEDEIFDFWEDEGMEIVDADTAAFYDRVEGTLEHHFEEGKWADAPLNWEEAQEYVGQF